MYDFETEKDLQKVGLPDQRIDYDTLSSVPLTTVQTKRQALINDSGIGYCVVSNIVSIVLHIILRHPWEESLGVVTNVCQHQTANGQASNNQSH